MLNDARSDMREELEGITSLQELMEIFLVYQQRKDATYDGSWAKKGLSGYVDGNLCRQMDRVGPLTDRIISGEFCLQDVSDTFDTLLDLGLYSLMGMRLLAAYFPQSFEKFMDQLKSEVAGE